jgi:hypothetical protein
MIFLEKIMEENKESDNIGKIKKFNYLEDNWEMLSCKSLILEDKFEFEINDNEYEIINEYFNN